MVCLAGKYADASEISFPIYNPSTTIGSIKYGELFNNGDVLRQPIKIPENAIKKFGGLKVNSIENDCYENINKFERLLQVLLQCILSLML